MKKNANPSRSPKRMPIPPFVARALRALRRAARKGRLEHGKLGLPLPFAMLEDGKDGIVPLFSSEARLEEALEKGRVPARTYSAASMPALQVLEILGKAGFRAVLNKSCATGEARIPPDLMRDLA